MLIEYIDKAMSKAVYEILEDGTYAGRIPLCPGVVAFGKTLYECQDELESVLEGWLIVKIRHGDQLPVIGRIDLNKGVPTLKGIAYGWMDAMQAPRFYKQIKEVESILEKEISLDEWEKL